MNAYRWLLTALAATSTLGGTAPAQSPQLSPSKWLNGDALVTAATGDQSTPAMAHGTGGTLVAWADRRGSLFANADSAESALDVFAVRLDAQGSPIESLPLALTQDAGDQSSPRVVWSGTNWLVTWITQVPTLGYWTAAIDGVRVSPQGQVLDATPVRILGFANSAIASYGVASDGTNWVVIAQGSSGGSAGVYAARLSSQGVVLDPTPVTLMPEGQLLPSLQLAHAGGVYLLAWPDWRTATGWDVVGRRFSSSLQWLDANPFSIGASEMNDTGPGVASNGAQFLVCWERSVPSTFQADIRAARITAAGVVLDTNAIELSDNLPYGNAMSAMGAWDGVQWYVSWSYAGLRLARVNASGAVLDFGGFPFGRAGTQPSQPVITGEPTGGVLLAWTDARAGSYEGLDIYSSHVVDAGNLGDEKLVSIGASAQVAAAVATSGANYMVVYQSETSGQRRLLAALVDTRGNALGSEPIEIAVGQFDAFPAVAWSGDVYLITWQHGDGVLSGGTILGRRVSADGVLLDPTPITVGTGAVPKVAGMNGDFLVAFARAIAFPVQQFPNVVRVRGSDGAVLGPPLVINSNYVVQLDVCVLGDRWLVAWQRNYWNNDTHSDIGAAFVDASGTPTPPFFVAGSFNGYNHSVSVAASGSEALFVWVQGNASNETRRLNARRLLPDGTFLDTSPFQLMSGVAAEQFRPDVAWDGLYYTVAFQDMRNRTSTLDQRSDVFGTRVRKNGTVVDAAGFPIETATTSATHPSIAGRGAGRALLASSIFRADTPHASYRVGLRTLNPRPVRSKKH